MTTFSSWRPLCEAWIEFKIDLWGACNLESTILRETNAARRLLVALAHPDDESFGPAGTIVRYASAGVAVHYVCGTGGEEGSADPGLLAGYNSMADLRRAELACAVQHLGLTGLHLLGYRDSGMENAPENQHPDCLFQAPLEQVVEAITGLVRQIRPQVVLTHDATGGYFHPDHIKMHQATTLAFRAASDPERFPHQLKGGVAPHRPQKLYYSVFPQRWVKLLVKIPVVVGQDPAAMGRNSDINLLRIADQDQAVTTRIRTAPYAATVQRAAECYASQMPAGANRFTSFLRRWMFRSDTYARVVPPFEDDRLEQDLFAGIESSPSTAEG
jgi:LmbE family N-acetylglucosaminyl deacetylase